MSDYFKRFLAPDSDNTPCATVMTLLLKSLQKVPELAESRSRQLIPLFLKYLGYREGVDVRYCLAFSVIFTLFDVAIADFIMFKHCFFFGFSCSSVDSFDCHNSKEKEWSIVLKEWLSLLRLFRNAQSLYQSQILKKVLINRLV